MDKVYLNDKEKIQINSMLKNKKLSLPTSHLLLENYRQMIAQKYADKNEVVNVMSKTINTYKY